MKLSLVCSVGVSVLVGLILYVRLRVAPLPATWEMAVHMTVADVVFGGD